MSFNVFWECGAYDVRAADDDRQAARCPTQEAAEAARRLLSGECERAKEPADEPDDYTLAELANQLIHDINHPTRCGFRDDGGVKWASRSVNRIWTLGFGEGLDAGVAQERARIANLGVRRENS